MYPQKNNPPFSIYDWFIVAVFLLLISLCFNIHSCVKEKQRNEPIHDTIITNAYDTIKVIDDSIQVRKQRKVKIIEKWNTIHDTIESTPDSSQYFLTKQFCPILNDSMPFKEINVCLAEGEKASELLFEEVIESNLKTEKIEQQGIIIDELNTINKSLVYNEIKSTKKAKLWRKIAGGSLITTIVVLSVK
jgi:hypothetical protein